MKSRKMNSQRAQPEQTDIEVTDAPRPINKSDLSWQRRQQCQGQRRFKSDFICNLRIRPDSLLSLSELFQYVSNFEKEIFRHSSRH